MTPDTLINESVSVWAFFDRGSPRSGGVGIFPIAMNWRRRLVKFQKLIFTNCRRVGDVKFIDLVCASEGGNFELEYNSDNHLWKLKRVMPKE